MQQVDYPSPKPISTLGNQYLGSTETAIVVDLIASVGPRVVLEIGTNLGATARAILDTVPGLQRYIGIDVPSQHIPRLGCQRDEVPFMAGRHAASDSRYWLLLADSVELTPADLEPVDAVFIDGDHSAVAVAHDSQLARQLTRSGGIIVWHDYNNPAVEVTTTLDRLVEQGWPLCAIRGTWLAFMRT
jgi:predicted O-methyltransferase YrrM